MKIGEFLSPDDVLVDVRAADKTAVLRLLADHAAKSVQLPAQEILTVILKREQLGSTGTGGGIAIPHARLAGLAKPFGVLLRLGNGIDFEAIDGRAVDLIFLLLLPAVANQDQLAALAAVARTLRNSNSTQKFRKARTAQELYGAMVGVPEH
jgi:nitrogen PTS system EIIA component